MRPMIASPIATLLLSTRRAPAILTLEDWCAKQQRRRDGPKPGDESTEAEGTGGESGGEDTQLEMTYDDFIPALS